MPATEHCNKQIYDSLNLRSKPEHNLQLQLQTQFVFLSQIRTVWRLMLSQREAQSRNDRMVHTNE